MRSHKCSHCGWTTRCSGDDLDVDRAEADLAAARFRRWGVAPLPLAIVLTYVAMGVFGHGAILILTVPLAVFGFITATTYAEGLKVPEAKLKLSRARERWAEEMMRVGEA